MNIIKKHNIYILKEKAKEFEGECLSTEYINNSTKYKWKCSNGHIFEKTWAEINNRNRWCRICRYGENPSLEDLINIANLKGGFCLSTKYIGVKEKYKFKCKNNHTWESNFYNIKKLKSWCPYCSKNFKNNIEMLQIKAKYMGGKCISKKYINNSTKYKWECADGHIFEKSWAKVKTRNQWCPKCKSNIMEEMCRFIFEQLTGKEFNRTKRILSNNLELDGYNEELKLAFEYNGEQHYRKIKLWHKNGRTLQNQKDIDKKKKEECKLKNIDLIIIPYTKSLDKNILFNFIKKKLDVKIISIKDNINWGDFSFGKNQLEKLRSIIEYKGGNLLEQSYLGYEHKNKILCKNNHEFYQSWDTIRKGRWCPYCSNQKACKDNCLAMLDKELAAEWHPTKNLPLTPYDVVSKSNKKVWWLCPKCNDERQVTISHRSNGLGKCPKCRERNKYDKNN